MHSSGNNTTQASCLLKLEETPAERLPCPRILHSNQNIRLRVACSFMEVYHFGTIWHAVKQVRIFMSEIINYVKRRSLLS